MNSKIRFTVVIPVYNMSPWIGENIEILKKQSYPHFNCYIGDDLSTDNSIKTIEDLIRCDERFTLVTHELKKYSLGNICTLINISHSEDEDIIVLIDGDDRLAHEDVLRILAGSYKKNDCWITYGSYADINNKNRDNICIPYPKRIAKHGRFRDVKWRASHLKTFKYKLWRQVEPSALTISQNEFINIKKRALFSGKWRSWYHWRKIQLADLLDETGRYTRRCSDRFITSPMLEMACERALFIPDILYYYRNYEKDLNFNVSMKKQKWYQRLTRYVLKYKQRYQKLTF